MRNRVLKTARAMASISRPQVGMWCWGWRGVEDRCDPLPSARLTARMTGCWCHYSHSYLPESGHCSFQKPDGYPWLIERWPFGLLVIDIIEN